MKQVKFNPQYSLYLRKLSKSKKGMVSISLVITNGGRRTRQSLVREGLPEIWELVQKKTKGGKVFPKGKIHLSFRIPEKAIRNCPEILYQMGHINQGNTAFTYLHRSVNLKAGADESK